jgi:hypothetical protein
MICDLLQKLATMASFWPFENATFSQLFTRIQELSRGARLRSFFSLECDLLVIQILSLLWYTTMDCFGESVAHNPAGRYSN